MNIAIRDVYATSTSYFNPGLYPGPGIYAGHGFYIRTRQISVFCGKRPLR